MIGKVLRGNRPGGLIYYLYGPGRHEEHTNPHIVAGWRDPAELEPPVRADGRRDFRQLNGLLQQTLAAMGAGAPARPVWHCVARAAPGDRTLSDAEWAQATGEIMHRTGLAPDGEDDDAVRWVAVRHADDHIHIGPRWLARTDGGLAGPTTITASGKLAWLSRIASACGEPRQATERPPVGQAALSPRRLIATAGESRLGPP